MSIFFFWIHYAVSWLMLLKIDFVECLCISRVVVGSNPAWVSCGESGAKVLWTDGWMHSRVFHFSIIHDA